MLEDAGLYNRQILGSAVLALTEGFDACPEEGVAHMPPSVPAQEPPAWLMARVIGRDSEYDMVWLRDKLASYDAGAIRYEEPGGAVDWSKGSFGIRYAAPMNDASFDALLRQAHWSRNSE